MSRYYTKSHEWIEFVESRKVARIGISNFAQQQLGEIIHIEFPSVGKALAASESVCVIESVKIAADIYTPVAGKVVAINKDVGNNPSMINDEAEKAWLVEVTYNTKPVGLLTPEQYASMVS